jgi:outer membrane lipoprotein-sorting protein
MNCPSQEQLARRALVLSKDAGLAAHLNECARCQVSLETMRSLARHLAQAHSRFDERHVEARERLLSLLPAASTSPKPARPWHRISHWVGGQTLRQRIVLGGVASAVLVAFTVLWSGIIAKPVYAMGKLADNIRQARSYQLTMTSEFKSAREPDKSPITAKDSGKIFWLSPGSYRMEFAAANLGGRREVTEIFPAGKPGIELYREAKSFVRNPARQGLVSPLMLLEKLAGFTGQADRELGAKKINGKSARGFQIEAHKIDPDAYSGPVEIWIDTDSELPVSIRYEMKTADVLAIMRMEDFQWNIDLDAKLFEPTPPEGYAEITREPAPLNNQVREITTALKTFAEFSGGHYPRVKMVYGDVTRDELVRMAGVQWPPKPAQLRDEKVGKIYGSMMGFAHINSILRDNPDAAYYGKTVGPNDKDKVLLRWKLDDGKYQVVFGDLHAEIVTAERLVGLMEGN